MKNSQLIIVVVAILAVAAAIFFKPKKKPCGCAGTNDAAPEVEAES